MNIIGYTYRADIYCAGCIIQELTGLQVNGNVEDNLAVFAKRAGIDHQDEHSFDSYDFPKVIFRTQAEDNEQCGHCGVYL